MANGKGGGLGGGMGGGMGGGLGGGFGGGMGVGGGPGGGGGGGGALRPMGSVSPSFERLLLSYLNVHLPHSECSGDSNP